MPYVKPEARDEIFGGRMPDSPGELNFLLTSIVSEYLMDEGLSYGAVNEVIGVLECVKLELYRRVAAPYENNKKEINGDVYPEEILLGGPDDGDSAVQLSGVPRSSEGSGAEGS